MNHKVNDVFLKQGVSLILGHGVEALGSAVIFFMLGPVQATNVF